uniref:Uncharacterized protein n=1 Tax=Clandestinovirus TaxID=2831644 RepID=A0A8F8PKJ4_9VIRU|nr:hypothetical protein KOM_12_563 [Clandestinovirus]
MSFTHTVPSLSTDPQQAQFIQTVNNLFSALPVHGHRDALMLDVMMVQTLIDRCRDFLPYNFALYLLKNNGRCSVTLDESAASVHALNKFPMLKDVIDAKEGLFLNLLFKRAPEHNNVLVLQDEEIERFLSRFSDLQIEVKKYMLK